MSKGKISFAFTADFNHLPDGPFGPTLRYEAGLTLDVDPEIAALATAAGCGAPVGETKAADAQ